MTENIKSKRSVEDIFSGKTVSVATAPSLSIGGSLTLSKDTYYNVSFSCANDSTHKEAANSKHTTDVYILDGYSPFDITVTAQCPDGTTRELFHGTSSTANTVNAYWGGKSSPAYKTGPTTFFLRSGTVITVSGSGQASLWGQYIYIE